MKGMTQLIPKMKRSDRLQEVLDDFTTRTFGRTNDGVLCVTCGSIKVRFQDFREDVHRTEFGISGMCQVCQDKTFSA